MAILRPEEAAKLGEALAVGRGMLLRYLRLRDHVEPSFAATLDGVVAARTPLLDRVEDAIRQRGHLPPARDQEPNELQALLDTLGGAMLGDTRVAARIADAEHAWAALLESCTDMAWDASEAKILTALREDSAAALERLTRHD